VFLVNEYLNQLHARGLGDKSARVIGIDVRNGTAFLAFNPAFEQTYGTSDEGIVLNGILRTLSQFPEIEKVQFEIDGKPMDTLGNIDLSQPQIVTGPGVAPVSTSPALP
jgi:spore germination protein GerM